MLCGLYGAWIVYFTCETNKLSNVKISVNFGLPFIIVSAFWGKWSQ